jgi:hypothetical protein
MDFPNMDDRGPLVALKRPGRPGKNDAALQHNLLTNGDDGAI